MTTLNDLAKQEIAEMSAYASRLEEKLREANLRAARAETARDHALDVAQAILWHRQLEVAAMQELLEDLHLQPSPSFTRRTKSLISNTIRAMQRLECAQPVQSEQHRLATARGQSSASECTPCSR